MELRYKIVFWGKGASKLTYRGKKGGKIEVIEDWKSECVNNLVADCRSGKKPNYEKRNRKLVGFGNGISCGWEQKSTAERFSIGRPQARKKTITEDSMNWKLRPSFVFEMIRRIFSSWTLVPPHLVDFGSFSFQSLTHSFICSFSCQ